MYLFADTSLSLEFLIYAYENSAACLGATYTSLQSGYRQF